MPLLEELNYDDFVQHCLQHDVKYIIPTREGELIQYATWASQLKKEGIHTMVSDVPALNIVMDKYQFYQELKRNGYPAISTYLYDDFISEIKESDACCYVVKERFGSGSQHLYLNQTYKEVLKVAQDLQFPIIQPYITGTEYSVDAYITKNYKVLGLVIRERVLVSNGESQITKIVRLPEIERLLERVIESLKLYGHIMLQFILDSKGKVHIIECNPRFGGASSLSVAAGLDSFKWFVQECKGVLDENLKFEPKILTQVRYAKDLIV